MNKLAFFSFWGEMPKAKLGVIFVNFGMAFHYFTSFDVILRYFQCHFVLFYDIVRYCGAHYLKC